VGLDEFWAKVQAVKNRENSAASFERFFAAHYGARWPALHQALLTDPRKSILSNPFGLQDYTLDEASLYPVKNLALDRGLRIADFCASPGGKSLAGIFELRGEGEWMCSDLSVGRVKRLKAVCHPKCCAKSGWYKETPVAGVFAIRTSLTAY
jgi:hypothetical protein